MSTGSESAEGPRPDRADLGAHLDEDAECLEDPVHCGDARHQHDWHASSTGKSAVTPAEEPAATAMGGQASTGETAQA